MRRIGWGKLEKSFLVFVLPGLFFGFFQAPIGAMDWPLSQEGMDSEGRKLIILSVFEEKIAGKATAVKIESALRSKGYEVVVDPKVAEIGERIVQVSERPNLDYTFKVIRGVLRPQAFSLPGGYIYLTEGLLEYFCEEDDEIAFVIGHEVAHVALRHYADYKLNSEEETRQVRKILENLDASDFLERSRLIMELNEVLSPYLLNIKRAKEIEADQFGVLYALRTGYKFSGALRLLEKLKLAYGDQFLLDTSTEQDVTKTPDQVAGSESQNEVHPSLSKRLEQLEIFRIKAHEIVKLFPDGVKALERGDYETASVIFESILSILPQSSAARLGLGIARHLEYWSSTQPDDFLISYVEEVELDLMNLLVRGEEKSGNWVALKKAEEAYRAVLEQEPGNPHAHNNLGVVFAETDRLDEAESAFLKALHIQEKRDFPVFNLGLLFEIRYQKTREARYRDQALEYFRKYLQTNPQDPVAKEHLDKLK
jgi:Zn-dependent protease with chaperone function